MTSPTHGIPAPAAVAPVLLRPEQAAEALAIGRTAVYELIRGGRLRSIKVGGLRRIPASSLIDFVRRLEEEQAA